MTDLPVWETIGQSTRGVGGPAPRVGVDFASVPAVPALRAQPFGLTGKAMA